MLNAIFIIFVISMPELQVEDAPLARKQFLLNESEAAALIAVQGIDRQVKLCLVA